MNRKTLLRFHGAEPIHRLAEHIQHAAKRRSSYRHSDRFAEIFHFHPAHKPFRRLHCDTAYAPFAEVLFNLGDDIQRLWDVETLARDSHRAVNRRQVVLLKEHVHHRADDFSHVPNFRLFLCHVSFPLFFSRRYTYDVAEAAPLTISINSFVIPACRILFICNVSLSINSDALRVAESIAVIRAACSAAADSNKIRKTSDSK